MSSCIQRWKIDILVKSCKLWFKLSPAQQIPKVVPLLSFVGGSYPLAKKKLNMLENVQHRLPIPGNFELLQVEKKHLGWYWEAEGNALDSTWTVAGMYCLSNNPVSLTLNIRSSDCGEHDLFLAYLPPCFGPTCCHCQVCKCRCKLVGCIGSGGSTIKQPIKQPKSESCHCCYKSEVYRECWNYLAGQTASVQRNRVNI